VAQSPTVCPRLRSRSQAPLSCFIPNQYNRIISVIIHIDMLSYFILMLNISQHCYIIYNYFPLMKFNLYPNFPSKNYSCAFYHLHTDFFVKFEVFKVSVFTSEVAFLLLNLQNNILMNISPLSYCNNYFPPSC